MRCDRCEAYAESLNDEQHCVPCAIIIRESRDASAREQRQVRRVPRFVTNTSEDRALREQAMRDQRSPDWKQDQAETTRLKPQPKEITTLITRDTARRIATRIYGLVDKEKAVDIIMQEITTAIGAQRYSLREANIARQAEWDAGNQIDCAYRGNELAGEVGESVQAVLDALGLTAQLAAAGGRVCNILKKLRREELGIVGSRSTIAALEEELGDYMICGDLVGMHFKIDVMGRAVPRKFNKTSEANGLRTRMVEAF